MTSLETALADYNRGIKRARDAYDADVAFADVARPCVRCGVQVIPYARWKQLDQHERQVCQLHAGYLPLMGRGLCRPCHARARRKGTLHRYSARNVPAAITAEEWRHLANPNRPLAEEIARLAPQFGRSESSLRAALWRAGIRSRFIGGHGERLRPADQRKIA